MGPIFVRSLNRVLAAGIAYSGLAFTSSFSDYLAGMQMYAVYVAVVLGLSAVFRKLKILLFLAGLFSFIFIVVARDGWMMWATLLLYIALSFTLPLIGKLRDLYETLGWERRDPAEVLAELEERKRAREAKKPSNKIPKPRERSSERIAWSPDLRAESLERFKPTPIEFNTDGLTVIGDAGAGLAYATSQFGKARVNAGLVGEQETVEVLTKAFKGFTNPIALVNSISFIGSDEADVDHALISGKDVYLIDSKKYKKGMYRVLSPSTVHAQYNDGSSQVHTIHMDSAIENYRERYPRTNFPKAFVLIHTTGGVSGEQKGDVFYGDKRAVVKELKALIGAGSETIDDQVFSSINGQRKH